MILVLSCVGIRIPADNFSGKFLEGEKKMYSFLKTEEKPRLCTECGDSISVTGEYYWWREKADPDPDDGPEGAGHCLCTNCAKGTIFVCPNCGEDAYLASILGSHCPKCSKESSKESVVLNLKWDIYEAIQLEAEWPTGEKDTPRKSLGYVCVTSGANLRESRFDGRLFGLIFEKINPNKPDDEAGEYSCQGCGMPIWHGSGVCGVTIHDTCPYCREAQ